MQVAKNRLGAAAIHRLDLGGSTRRRRPPSRHEYAVYDHHRAQPPAPARLADLMLDFLAYLELERGLSRNTLEAYRSDLQQFGEFLARRGLDPLTITPVELASFVSELADGREGRRRSRRRRFSARSRACGRSTATCAVSG